MKILVRLILSIVLSSSAVMLPGSVVPVFALNDPGITMTPHSGNITLSTSFTLTVQDSTPGEFGDTITWYLSNSSNSEIYNPTFFQNNQSTITSPCTPCTIVVTLDSADIISQGVNFNNGDSITSNPVIFHYDSSGNFVNTAFDSDTGNDGIGATFTWADSNIGPTPTPTVGPSPTTGVGTPTVTPTPQPQQTQVSGYVCADPWATGQNYFLACQQSDQTFYFGGATVQISYTSGATIGTTTTDSNGFYVYNFDIATPTDITVQPLDLGPGQAGLNIINAAGTAVLNPPYTSGQFKPGFQYLENFVLNTAYSPSANDWGTYVGGFTTQGQAASRLLAAANGAYQYAPVLKSAGYYGVIAAVALSSAPCFGGPLVQPGSQAWNLANDNCYVNAGLKNLSASASAQLKVWYADGSTAILTIPANTQQTITGLVTQVELLTNTAVQIATDTVTQISATPTPAVTATPTGSGGTCDNSFPPFPWSAMPNITSQGITEIGPIICAEVPSVSSTGNRAGNPASIIASGATITLPSVTQNSPNVANGIFVYIPMPSMPSTNCNNCATIATHYVITCGGVSLDSANWEIGNNNVFDNNFYALNGYGPGSYPGNPLLDNGTTSINLQGYTFVSGPYQSTEIKPLPLSGGTCAGTATAPQVQLQVEAYNDPILAPFTVAVQIEIALVTVTIPQATPQPTTTTQLQTPLPTAQPQTNTQTMQETILGCSFPGGFLLGPCLQQWVTIPIVTAITNLQTSLTSALANLTASPQTSNTTITNTTYTGSVDGQPSTGTATGSSSATDAGVQTVTVTLTQPSPFPNATVPATITLPGLGTATGTVTGTGTTTAQFTGTTTTDNNNNCGGILYVLFSGFSPLMQCLFEPTQPISQVFTVTDTQTGGTGDIRDVVKTKVGFADFYEVAEFICGSSDPSNPNSTCNIGNGLFGNFQGGSWSGYIPWLDPSSWVNGTANNTIVTWTVTSSNPIVSILQKVVTIGILIFAIGGIGSAILAFFGIGSNEVEPLTEEQGSSFGEDAAGSSNHSWPE